MGNGWGLSTDGGRSWRNWTYDQLGPEWQYVVPGGIGARGDTIVIATADGLQVTTDDGSSWTAIGDAVGPPARGPADTALPLLANEYVAGPAAPTGWLVRTTCGATSGCGTGGRAGAPQPRPSRCVAAGPTPIAGARRVGDPLRAPPAGGVRPA